MPGGRVATEEAGVLDSALEFSVVVPVHNEAGNVETLVGEIARALDGRAQFFRIAGGRVTAQGDHKGSST